MSLIVNPYRYGGGGGGEINPPWANVASLLHFDGTNGSTTFTDQKGITWTGNGNAKIDTSIVKFGTGALLLDGAGDFLTSNWQAPASFLHDGSAFTVRGWMRLSAAGATQVILENGGLASSGRGISLYRTASNSLCVDISKGTSGTYAARLASPIDAFDDDEWTFFSVAHDPTAPAGNQLRLHVNGVKVAADDMVSPSASTPTFVMNVGRYVPSNSLFLNGRLDELQFVEGLALYDGDYTPPTSAFPNS